MRQAEDKDNVLDKPTLIDLEARWGDKGQDMKEIPRRIRSIENACGYKEFWEHANQFMGTNNFSMAEIKIVMHLMNSFYFMGQDLENFSYQPERLNETDHSGGGAKAICDSLNTTNK